MPLNQPIPSRRGRTVWVVGGSAGIGQALAQLQGVKAALLEPGRPVPQAQTRAFDLDQGEAALIP